MPTDNTYLVCVRDIVSGQYGAEPGATAFIRVPPNKDDYDPGDAIERSNWAKAVIAAADGTEDEITGATGDVLLFVHGYNNERSSVLWRTRKLQETLEAQGWSGLVLAFDWPSDNSTLNYLEDRADASAVSIGLIEDVLPILVQGQNPSGSADECRINVHLLGHSTGAYVIMEAFANAAKKGAFFKQDWRIGQVAFISGDVSRDSLSEDSDWARPMFERIFRFTNYSNGYDRVLAISNAKRLGASPRAGRVGLPSPVPRSAVNVDCSSYFLTKKPGDTPHRGTFNHSWQIGDPNFALDLAMTLEGEIDRERLPTRRSTNGRLELLGGQSRPAFQSLWDSDG